MPSIRSAGLSIGAFYNPHLAQEIYEARECIDHLAMADPPAAHDEWFPRIKECFPLLLHDYLGQLADPLSPEALERAQRLQGNYGSSWVAEHFQCIHTQDGSRTLDYVFPPLYTEEFLSRFVTNARELRNAVQADLVMENIPGFFSVDKAQMTEAEFLRRFFDETGCGFLIDVPHLWLAAHYSGQEAWEMIAKFPLEKVVEIHVAGVEHDRDLDGPWVAPSAPSMEILELAVRIAERAPRLRAITLDAFSPNLSARVLVESVQRMRQVFSAN